MSWLVTAKIAEGRIKEASGSQVEEYLQQLVEIMKGHKPPDFEYGTTMEYFLRNGRLFPSAPLNQQEMAGLKHALAMAKFYKPKQCYYNSQHMAIGNPKIRYAEGYLITDGLPLPIAHGWNVVNGKVVDFTMKHANGGKPILGELPAGWEYFGVEMDTSMIRDIWSKHKVSIPLVDNYEDGFPLLRGKGASGDGGKEL